MRRADKDGRVKERRGGEVNEVGSENGRKGKWGGVGKTGGVGKVSNVRFGKVGCWTAGCAGGREQRAGKARSTYACFRCEE